jgi:hypothetical protein
MGWFVVVVLIGFIYLACTSHRLTRAQWVEMPERKSYKVGTRYKFPVRGFSKGFRGIASLLTPLNTPIVLVRNKYNRHDPNAISVFSVRRNRLHRNLGYVPTSAAKRIAPKMDGGSRYHGIIVRKYTQNYYNRSFQRLDAQVVLVPNNPTR